MGAADGSQDGGASGDQGVKCRGVATPGRLGCGEAGDEGKIGAPVDNVAQQGAGGAAVSSRVAACRLAGR